MKNYFKIEEFIMVGSNPTDEIKAKIQVHINEINPIRNMLGFPIMVSKNSGYRSVEHELKKGRSGNSQHTFKEKGAVDYTCKTKEQTELLLQALKSYSKYTRICYYPNNNFIHCDYKSEGRQYFEGISPSARWSLKSNL